MLAQDCWQQLRQGIDLLNLLALYPVPGNPAIVSAIEPLLEEGPLRLALEDLKLLQRRLLDLPESSGPEITAPDFADLESGPLRELLRRLGQLNALYLGKQGKGATTLVREQLEAIPSLFDDVHSVQLALVRLHQLKS